MNEDKSPQKKVDLNNYEDPIELSPKNLEIGLWLATHKKIIYKITIIILAALAAGFLIYSIYGYAYYFIFGREQDKSLQDNQAGIDLSAYRQQNIPLDLIIGQPKVINHDSGADYVVKMKNPNEKQTANFNFCFIKETEKVCGSSFVLPDEEKNILIIGSKIKGFGKVSFEITDISWQKIKAGEIPDWGIWRDSRLNFSITDVEFSNYSNNVNYLEFNITNNSSYGYFKTPLNITINQNEETVAVNRYILSGLSSKETKSVRLFWPEAANLGGSILIVPDLNILDNSVYKPYTAN